MKRILVALAAALAFTLTCAAQAQDTAKKGAAAAQQAANQEKTDLIDINTATSDQFQGDPRHRRCVLCEDYQERQYKAKNELVQKKILPQGANNKPKDLIIAKQK